MQINFKLASLNYSQKRQNNTNKSNLDQQNNSVCFKGSCGTLVYRLKENSLLSDCVEEIVGIVQLSHEPIEFTHKGVTAWITQALLDNIHGDNRAKGRIIAGIIQDPLNHLGELGHNCMDLSADIVQNEVKNMTSQLDSVIKQGDEKVADWLVRMAKLLETNKEITENSDYKGSIGQIIKTLKQHGYQPINDENRKTLKQISKNMSEERIIIGFCLFRLKESKWLNTPMINRAKDIFRNVQNGAYNH